MLNVEIVFFLVFENYTTNHYNNPTEKTTVFRAILE